MSSKKTVGKYSYFNDDRSLLRVGPDGDKQWSPAKAAWVPGGYPSLRAAHLSYKQAYDLAYRLVLSFGDEKDLATLDIGPEECPEEES